MRAYSVASAAGSSFCDVSPEPCAKTKSGYFLVEVAQSAGVYSKKRIRTEELLAVQVKNFLTCRELGNEATELLDELAEATEELVTELKTLEDLELAKLEDVKLIELAADDITTLELIELEFTTITDEIADRLTEDTDDFELVEIETALALVVDTEPGVLVACEF